MQSKAWWVDMSFGILFLASIPVLGAWHPSEEVPSRRVDELGRISRPRRLTASEGADSQLIRNARDPPDEIGTCPFSRVKVSQLRCSESADGPRVSLQNRPGGFASHAIKTAERMASYCKRSPRWGIAAQVAGRSGHYRHRQTSQQDPRRSSTEPDVQCLHQFQSCPSRLFASRCFMPTKPFNKNVTCRLDV